MNYATPLGTGVSFSMMGTLADGITPASLGVVPSVTNTHPEIATAVIDSTTGLLKVTPVGVLGSTVITLAYLIGSTLVTGVINLSVVGVGAATGPNLPSATLVGFMVNGTFPVA